MNESEMNIDMSRAAGIAADIHGARERTWSPNMIDGSEDPRIVAAQRERAVRRMQAGRIYKV